MSAWELFSNAVREHAAHKEACRSWTREMAECIAGNLRDANVSKHVLDKLKRELEQYDARKHKWKPRT